MIAVTSFATQRISHSASVPAVRTWVLASFLIAAATGCGKKQSFSDAGMRDAPTFDAGGTIDASPDARPPVPAYEVTGGAAHVSGARFSADVQLGHGLDQTPATGAAHRAEGNAAVKP